MALSDQETVLVAACRGDVSLITDDNWAAVLALAGVHDVAPLVADHLRRSQGEYPHSAQRTARNENVQEVERLHAVSVIQQGLQEGELNAVLSSLAAIPALVFKGPSLSALYYPAGARLSRDVDLLVREPDYAPAREALTALGYRVMDEYDESIQRRQSKDVAFIRQDETAMTWSVELHWRLTEPGAPDLAESNIWERAERISFSRGTFMSPSPEHTLLLLALNLRKHRFARLKTVCDIARVVTFEAGTLDWQLLHDEAHQAGVCALLRHSLELSATLMGADPPRLPRCGRRNSPVARVLSRLATVDTVFAEGRVDDPAKTVSGLIPFLSLDNLLSSLHLVYSRLTLSPELASYYRSGVTNVYGSRRQYWRDTAGRLARALRTLARSGSGLGRAVVRRKEGGVGRDPPALRGKRDRTISIDSRKDDMTNVRQVPLVDLTRPHTVIKDDLTREFDAVLSSMQLFLGPNVRAFEEEFTRYLDVGHCIGVCDGTAALHLALRACDIGPGDEVITVSHTFFATAEAILLAGATPVFVDVDPVTYTIDVAAAERAVTSRTRAILPVHLYGMMADMDAVMDLARRRRLKVIEDASQAHGARRNGKAAGTVGHVGCFSFYYSKNLGAYGEAGGIVTNNGDLAHRLQVLRDHGSPRRYYHEEVGINGRLDELQAAVLRLKLPRLDAGNRQRRLHALNYTGRLRDLPVETPAPAGEDHVFHLYVIRVDDRDRLQAYLQDKGVHTGIHYPIPCHLQPACAEFGHGPGSLPVTEALTGSILSLPMFPELRDEEIAYVAQVLEGYYAAGSTVASTSVHAAS
jgi:dTDP-4-amino-4,6-dideoxygalactose transaminase